MRFYRNVNESSLYRLGSVVLKSCSVGSFLRLRMFYLRPGHAQGDQRLLQEVPLLFGPQKLNSRSRHVCSLYVAGNTKMTTLYEDFMQCGGRWQNSTILKTIRKIHRNGRRAARKWLTKQQMLEHFKDPKIVQAIIVRKETDKELAKLEIRDHPELPGLVCMISHCRCFFNLVPCS